MTSSISDEHFEHFWHDVLDCRVCDMSAVAIRTIRRLALCRECFRLNFDKDTGIYCADLVDGCSANWNSRLAGKLLGHSTDRSWGKPCPKWQGKEDYNAQDSRVYQQS